MLICVPALMLRGDRRVVISPLYSICIDVFLAIYQYNCDFFVLFVQLLALNSHFKTGPTFVCKQ